MSITVFADVILPNSIVAAGVRGKNMRRNDRVQTDSGLQWINVGWTTTLREFEIGIVPLRVDQWQAIEALHEITEGGAYGFLMEDPKDRSVSSGVVAAVAAGYQLYKRYSDARSGRTRDRKVTRPRAGSFAISVGGTLLSPGQYTLDDKTGIVTIGSNPAAETVTWTGLVYVPVHFMNDFIDWELVAPGAADARYAAGPSVILQEIRE